MDSYIVRVYRRNSVGGDELAGMVERVGSDARQAFATRDELWAFLKAVPGRRPELSRGRPGRR